MAANITYLTQEEAIRTDQELMSKEYGYTLDILMELAGQSVAHAVHHCNTNFHE
jgi:NAD(P)H-hydrate repair Nnr-like enzyme with NAD(P)H-hydrate epimerase domain